MSHSLRVIPALKCILSGGAESGSNPNRNLPAHRLHLERCLALL